VVYHYTNLTGGVKSVLTWIARSVRSVRSVWSVRSVSQRGSACLTCPLP